MLTGSPRSRASNHINCGRCCEVAWGRVHHASILLTQRLREQQGIETLNSLTQGRDKSFTCCLLPHDIAMT